jgi:secernin
MFSCDTFVVLGSHTEDGRVLVAKNSDREPNEPNNVVRVPSREFAPHTEVRCTYISIPQVPKTHSVLLLQPSWLWGAEYGTNSFGVCIGNEALFSSLGSPSEPALLG